MIVPNVLIDFHHHALAESLHILFADHMGAFVWMPYGMDWFDSGVWNFERKHHGDAVARQYLEGIWANAKPVEDGIVRREDPRHPGRVHWGVTLQRARELDLDYVVSTLPDNDVGFAHLARMKNAKFGVQIGNAGQVSAIELADFVLSSSTLPQAGFVHPDTWNKPLTWQGKPTVIYHQAFNLVDFHPGPGSDGRTVASFVNCFPEGPSYPDFLVFARTHRELADFKIYGATGRPQWWDAPEPYGDEFQAGDIGPVPDVAKAMRLARIIWHSKHWSDGYGHVIHNAFAVGRPVIGYQRYYADKLAGPLWTPETSINIEGLSHDELAARIGRLIDDDGEWFRMCDASIARFRELVDFESEAATIIGMLENL
jgi:glycosyltransferase involved in cell wall biosynthesis